MYAETSLSRFCSAGIAVLASVLLPASAGFGALIEIEPDNSEWFSPDGVIDGHGVTIRKWLSGSGSTNKLYVVSPHVDGVGGSEGWLGIQPSTGDFVFGRYPPGYMNCVPGSIYFVFDTPTNFISIDILWPQEDWTEGAVLDVWAEDAEGAESNVQHRGIYEGAEGTHTEVNFFHPRITRFLIDGWDRPGFQQHAIGFDDMSFIDINSASTIALEPGETIRAPEGMALGAGDRLVGTGIVDGDLHSTGGTVSPGASPGEIQVTGDYEQAGGSQLRLELGEDAYDRLLVAGKATLAGTLDITMLDGFAPEEGSAFTVVSYNDREGEFDDIQGLTFEGGFLAPTYGPDSLTLAAVPEPTTLAMLAVGGLALIRRRR